MPNLQKNEIEKIKKEINLLQGRLKKNEKIWINFKRVNAHQKNRSIKKTKDGLFPNQKNTKYSEECILKNKIELIKKNTNLLQNILAQVKKERYYLKKGK